MLNKEIPFLRIGLPLCAGIISGLYFKPDFHFLLLTAFFIFTGFLASLYFNKYQSNQLFGFSLNLALFLCGMYLYNIEKTGLSTFKQEETRFRCTLADYPEEKENSKMLKVKLDSKIYGSQEENVNGSMILYCKTDSSESNFLPGDILIIKCIPAEITNHGNPYEFDYRFYMENHGIKYYSFITSRNIIYHGVPSSRKLRHKALIVREEIIEMFKKRGITGERLALVSAITLGEKSKLDPELKQNFIKAGVMHIMAVSGLHAVVLSLFIFNLLFFLKRRFNILRILITILVLWSFAFVTGLTPSVLRATLMFTFIQTGSLIQRRVNGINSVLASAFVLMLINPCVIFDAGFLLSYSAVIYIICFYQSLYIKFHSENWLADKVWQSFVVTVVAQAGTLPLTIMLFNRFPTYFILSNIIIVPLSSLMIIIGCLIPVLFPVLFLSVPLAKVLSFLTGLTESLTSAAASLPGSNIERIGMTPIECILLTGTIFLFITYLLKKGSLSFFYPVSLLIVFVTAGTVMEFSVKTTNELIVYNTPGATTIAIKTGKILTAYSDTLMICPEISRHCSTLGLRVKLTSLNNGYRYIRADNKNILITNSLNQSILQNINPHVVILAGSKLYIDNNFVFSKPPEALIISSGASSGFHFPKQFNLKGIDTVHFVKKSGAFVKTI